MEGAGGETALHHSRAPAIGNSKVLRSAKGMEEGTAHGHLVILILSVTFLTLCLSNSLSNFLEASVLHLEKLPNLMLRDYAVPWRRVSALAILSLLFQNIRFT